MTSNRPAAQGMGSTCFVHGRGRLDARAKATMRSSELHALDDIDRGSPRSGAAKAQPLIDIRHPDTAPLSAPAVTRSARGNPDKTPAPGPRFAPTSLPETGGAQTEGAAIDHILAAADVAADGREPAAGILVGEPTIMSAPRSDGSIVCLNSPVAVIDHADDVRVDKRRTRSARRSLHELASAAWRSPSSAGWSQASTAAQRPAPMAG